MIETVLKTEGRKSLSDIKGNVVKKGLIGHFYGRRNGDEKEQIGKGSFFSQNGESDVFSHPFSGSCDFYGALHCKRAHEV